MTHLRNRLEKTHEKIPIPSRGNGGKDTGRGETENPAGWQEKPGEGPPTGKEELQRLCC